MRTNGQKATKEKAPKEIKPASFARGASVMTLGTGVSRITGFVRTAALAAVLGLTADHMADAFNLANITPNIIYDLILGGVISSLFIPVFVEYLNQKSEEEAWHVANSVFNLTTLILATITILLCIGAPWVIKAQTFLASKRTGIDADATFLLRFFIIEIVFYGLCAVWTGILNSYKHFTAPAFAPIANNLVVIATVLLYRQYPNRYLLAVGATLGVVAMALVQLPYVRRTGFRWKPIIDFNHPGVRKIARLSGPVFLYVVINQAGLWVVNILALQVNGGLSAYQYAWILFQLPYGIVAVSIITALFPSLSEHHASADKQRIIDSTSQGIRTTAFILIPSSVGMAILSKPIVQLLFEHVNFRSADTEMLASVMFYFVLGLFFFAVFMLVLKVFYAMQDTKTPMIVAAIIIAFNILIDFVYFYGFKSDVMKVSGLALGNSTAYLFGSILVWAVLRKRLGSIDGKRVAASLIRICIASTAMGVACWATCWGMKEIVGDVRFLHQLLQVSSAIVVSLVVFLASAHIVGSEEIQSIRNLAKRLFSRNSAAGASG